MQAGDSLTMRAADSADTVTIVFESQNQERVSEYEMRLMDLDGDHLGIPDTKYKCVIKLSSSELQRICRDLSVIAESVQLVCTKDGIRFGAQGDLGSANIKLSQYYDADKASFYFTKCFSSAYLFFSS